MVAREQRAEAADGRRATPRALIVDDDAPTRTLLDIVLERRGFRSVTAAGGEEAIMRLRRNRFDVVLLDLVMPHTNGLDVYRFLRTERPGMLRRTIVFTGAAGGTLDEFLAESDPSCEVIRKPLDLETMLAAIERASGTSAADRRAGRAG